MNQEFYNKVKNFRDSLVQKEELKKELKDLKAKKNDIPKTIRNTASDKIDMKINTIKNKYKIKPAITESDVKKVETKLEKLKKEKTKSLDELHYIRKRKEIKYKNIFTLSHIITFLVLAFIFSLNFSLFLLVLYYIVTILLAHLKKSKANKVLKKEETLKEKEILALNKKIEQVEKDYAELKIKLNKLNREIDRKRAKNNEKLLDEIAQVEKDINEEYSKVIEEEINLIERELEITSNKLKEVEDFLEQDRNIPIIKPEYHKIEIFDDFLEIMLDEQGDTPKELIASYNEKKHREEERKRYEEEKNRHEKELKLLEEQNKLDFQYKKWMVKVKNIEMQRNHEYQRLKTQIERLAISEKKKEYKKLVAQNKLIKETVLRREDGLRALKSKGYIPSNSESLISSNNKNIALYKKNENRIKQLVKEIKHAT